MINSLLGLDIAIPRVGVASYSTASLEATQFASRLAIVASIRIASWAANVWVYSASFY